MSSSPSNIGGPKISGIQTLPTQPPKEKTGSAPSSNVKMKPNAPTKPMPQSSKLSKTEQSDYNKLVQRPKERIIDVNDIKGYGKIVKPYNNLVAKSNKWTRGAVQDPKAAAKLSGDARVVMRETKKNAMHLMNKAGVGKEAMVDFPKNLTDKNLSGLTSYERQGVMTQAKMYNNAKTVHGNLTMHVGQNDAKLANMQSDLEKSLLAGDKKATRALTKQITQLTASNNIIKANLALMEKEGMELDPKTDALLDLDDIGDINDLVDFDGLDDPDNLDGLDDGDDFGLVTDESSGPPQVEKETVKGDKAVDGGGIKETDEPSGPPVKTEVEKPQTPVKESLDDLDPIKENPSEQLNVEKEKIRGDKEADVDQPKVKDEMDDRPKVGKGGDKPSDVKVGSGPQEKNQQEVDNRTVITPQPKAKLGTDENPRVSDTPPPSPPKSEDSKALERLTIIAELVHNLGRIFAGLQPESSDPKDKPSVDKKKSMVREAASDFDREISKPDVKKKVQDNPQDIPDAVNSFADSLNANPGMKAMLAFLLVGLLAKLMGVDMSAFNQLIKGASQSKKEE